MEHSTYPVQVLTQRLSDLTKYSLVGNGVKLTHENQ
jgi:hypothetical protein